MQLNSTPNITASLSKADRLAKREKRLGRRIEVIAERLTRFQNFRLGTAIVFCVLILLFAIHPDGRFEWPAVVVFAAVFVTFVRLTRRLSRHLQNLKHLRVFYDRQEKRCRGLTSGRSVESALKAAENLPFMHDLGILGPHSLWSLIDETLTDLGQRKLLEWMSAAPMATAETLKRQALVQNLRRERWFFSRWSVDSVDAEDFRLSSSQILKFIKKPFVEKGFLILLIVNWAAWFAMLAGVILAVNFGWGIQGVIFACFVALSFISLNKVGSPFLKGVGLSHHLSQLEPIFAALEKRTRISQSIQLLAPVTKASGPSREARKLNGVLAFMGIQANPLLNLLLNAAIPWSMTATHFLEHRRRKIAYTFPQCLDELAELEALASLVIFDAYQTRTYPRLTESGRRPALNFSGLYHPLIDRTRVVANDFAFPAGRNLGLITGSNMSGKSTFLRTVGLNQILANMGAPVFADSYESSPFQVETCIEVSDSLRDGFSYFYAEVRRLKALIEAARSGTTTLYLIDEIFRGTNNRERQIGSRSVIRTLSIFPQAVGFISTHDLELTSLEASQQAVMNLHFREEFSETGKMVFAYLLRAGPCPTTNALKIMAAEGIEVDEA
jgi:hypothetical protein